MARSWWRRRSEPRDRAEPSERRIVGLLVPATFFQGYDGMILGLALPLIGRTFGLGAAGLGALASVISAGAFGALILLPLADRVGRRPVLSVTILGYTAATFLTAFSQGIADFAVWQFVARVFLETEYALATIVLVEALSPLRRGRALGLVSSMSAFGQAAAGIGFLLVVALDGSWRSLYLIGVLPLLLVARARRDLPETMPPAPPGTRRRSSLRGLRMPWVAGVAALSFLYSVFPSAVTTFASFLVLNEWKWNLSNINPLYVAVWVLSVSGFFVAGRLADAWGRKATAALFFAGAAAAGLVAFHQSGTIGRVLGLAMVIFFLTGATPCMAAYSTEPFPARSRGRVGAVLRLLGIAGAAVAPALTGLLSKVTGGVGPALSLVGLSYGLGAVVILWLLPETRGFDAEAQWAADEPMSRESPDNQQR